MGGYSKAALNHTETVISYLTRYTHRIAISNHRIQNIYEGQVAIHYNDYRKNGKNENLSGEEFVRYYLMYIVAKGFILIRYYGFLANCCRQQWLEQIHHKLQSQLRTPEKSQAE